MKTGVTTNKSYAHWDMQIEFQSINCYGETLCGDNFIQENLANSSVFVLSDGMGHGPQANTLSSITCDIVMSEWNGIESIPRLVDILGQMLPPCPVRGIGYSTFTIVDLDNSTSIATIVEYDNPPTLLFRGSAPLTVGWDSIEATFKGQTKELLYSTVKLKAGDRVVVCSDGVTQSGLGLEGLPSGWGSLALSHFVEKVVMMRGKVTSSELVSRIMSKAVENERYYPRDDISCMALTM